jgi:hypothetical protein
MDLVEVDVFRAQPGQARVDLGEDGLARQPAAVGTVVHAAVHLRGDDRLVPAGDLGKCPPHDLLAGPVGIDVGGVEEVDAELDRSMDERPARRVVERPLVVAALRVAVRHAAKSDPRHVQAGLPELRVLHVILVSASRFFAKAMTPPSGPDWMGW